MTVPAAAALIGVPDGTAMSTPGWKEQSPFGRQRGPYGLEIGPLTGQIKPEDEETGAAGAPLGGGEGGRLSAARMRAASDALTAASCLASSVNAFSFTLIDESVSRFESSAVASCCCVDTSCCVTACCCSVRTRIASVSAATRILSLRVSSRAAYIAFFALFS